MIRENVRKLRKLRKLLDNPVYVTALFQGVAAAVEHLAALRMTQPRTLIDIGANNGQFTILATGTCPKIKIYALEPLPLACAKFRSVTSGVSEVTLFQVAAGTENSTAELHVSGHADSSSLLPISPVQSRLFPGTEEVNVVSVDVRRLDDLLDGLPLDGPVLMKLDVQGFELEALRGSVKTLCLTDYVYVELSFLEFYAGQPLAHSVIEWLHQQGFILGSVHNLVTDQTGMPLQADMLFKRAPTHSHGNRQ